MGIASVIVPIAAVFLIILIVVIVFSVRSSKPMPKPYSVSSTINPNGYSETALLPLPDFSQKSYLPLKDVSSMVFSSRYNWGAIAEKQQLKGLGYVNTVNVDLSFIDATLGSSVKSMKMFSQIFPPRLAVLLEHNGKSQQLLVFYLTNQGDWFHHFTVQQNVIVDFCFVYDKRVEDVFLVVAFTNSLMAQNITDVYSLGSRQEFQAVSYQCLMGGQNRFLAIQNTYQQIDEYELNLEDDTIHFEHKTELTDATYIYHGFLRASESDVFVCWEKANTEDRIAVYIRQENGWVRHQYIAFEKAQERVQFQASRDLSLLAVVSNGQTFVYRWNPSSRRYLESTPDPVSLPENPEKLVVSLSRENRIAHLFMATRGQETIVYEWSF